MKTKRIATVLLTLVVFLSAVVLGITTVYRVDDVRVDIVALSNEGRTEAENVQARLKKAYYKQGIFSTDRTKADEVLSEFPYLRLVSFSRAYPNLLVVELAEDEEVYAVPTDETNASFYILNDEGIVLGTRNDYVNRVDSDVQAKNVLLTAERIGRPLTGEDCKSVFFPFCQSLNEMLDDKIRANVTAIRFVAPTSQPEQAYYCIQTTEGVRLYLFGATENAVEKARKALEKYASLSDTQKMTGRVAVREDAQGLYADYSEHDDFSRE